MNKDYALVTGASSGIGLCMARRLADMGYPLILVARRVERLENLAKEIREQTKVDVRVIPMDLSAPDAAARLRAETQRLGLHTEILINNAGYGMQGKFVEMDTDKLADRTRRIGVSEHAQGVVVQIELQDQQEPDHLQQ